MAYGDSANWDGSIPAASLANYTIEWKTEFGGVVNQPPVCVFNVTSELGVREFAEALANAWNTQLPYARRATQKRGKVQFDGEVTRMQVRGWRTSPSPETPGGFVDVEFGARTPVLRDLAGTPRFFVFNA